MKKNFRFIFLIIWIPFIFQACEKERIYQQYREVEGNEWALEDKKSFKIDVEDTTARYNLLVQIRHKGTYPYSNIWIMLAEKNPEGKVFRTRYDLPLAEKSGKWKGQGLGDIIDHEFLVRQEIKLPRSGTYVFSIKHDMRMDPVPDILDIGFRLDKISGR
ncbi:MAG: gliding motility lipoprotein GldH [Bacteroidia bacterium]